MKHLYVLIGVGEAVAEDLILTGCEIESVREWLEVWTATCAAIQDGLPGHLHARVRTLAGLVDRISVLKRGVGYDAEDLPL